MVFTAVGLLVGSEASRGSSSPAPAGETVKLLAEATLALVLFADASRIDLRALRGELSVPLRLLGIGLPLTIVGGLPRRARRVPRALVARGARARGDPRADRRRARPGGRHAARGCRPRSPGPERRERPQRRDLRAAVLHRARDRAGGVRSDRRRSRGPARASSRSATASSAACLPGVAAAASSSSRAGTGSSTASWLQVVPARRRRRSRSGSPIRSAAPGSSPRSSAGSSSARSRRRSRRRGRRTSSRSSVRSSAR